MLSKENCDKLNENYLYKCEPDRSRTEPFWCKNWTFKVHKTKDGVAWMLDTYYESWDSHKIQVTDENINDFAVVFDFREVKRVSDNDWPEYNENDLYCVATDSGGHSCGHLHWIKQDAKRSKEKLLERAKIKLESAKDDVKWAEREIEEINNGTHWKLNS